MYVIGSRSRPIKLNRCFSGNLHPFLRLDIDMRYCRTQIVIQTLCFLYCFYGIRLHIHFCCVAVEIESHSPLIIHIAVRHIGSCTCRLSKRIFCFIFQFGWIEHIRCAGDTCSFCMIYLLCVTRCLGFCSERECTGIFISRTDIGTSGRSEDISLVRIKLTMHKDRCIFLASRLIFRTDSRFSVNKRFIANRFGINIATTGSIINPIIPVICIIDIERTRVNTFLLYIRD